MFEELKKEELQTIEGGDPWGVIMYIIDAAQDAVYKAGQAVGRWYLSHF